MRYTTNLVNKLFFLLTVLFFSACGSKDDQKQSEIVLTDYEKNDNRWVKTNNLNCYLFDSEAQPGDSIIWEGDCLNGKINGIGKLTKYSNGIYFSTFEGEYNKGFRKGKGKLEKNNGEIIDGNFFYEAHGQAAITYPNGSFEEGFYYRGDLFNGIITKANNDSIYIVNYDTVSDSAYFNELKKINDFKYPELNTQTKYFYDENWNICEADVAEYYRLITMESKFYPEKGLVQDFYISGKLQNKYYSSYIDLYNNKHINDSIDERFNESGLKTYEALYKFGDPIYKKDWDDNGELKTHSKYVNGKVVQVDFFDLESHTRHIYNDSLDKLNQMREEQYNENGKLTLKTLASFYEGDDYYYPIGIKKRFNENGTVEEIYRLNYRNINVKKSVKDIIPDDEFNYLRNNEFEVNTIKNVSNIKFLSDINSPLKLSDDYSILAVCERISGSKDNEYAGVCFNANNFNNSIEFSITGDGYYQILKRVEGILIPIQTFKRSYSIKNGSNQLQILKRGDKIYFSINEDVVKSIKSFDLVSNNVSLLFSTGVRVKYKDVIVKNILSKEQVDKAKPESEKPRQGNSEWKSSGSGIVISEDGYIATNYHVVEDAKDIEISFTENKQIKNYKASIVKSDKANDISLIKIADPNFKKFDELKYNFKLSPSSVGIDVFTLGYPLTDILGSEIKFTDGRISSRTGAQGDVRLYQTTAPIQPGNSGGPLFDFEGNLIGINTAAIKKDIAENVSYAVKTTYLKNLIDALPFEIELPDNNSISRYKIDKQVKILSNYTVFIKVK